MSLLSDVTDAISPGVGTLLGAGLGFLGQQDTNATQAAIAQQTNQMSADEAQKNRDFQAMMSNTAYQRQTADMAAAGLNPMLAYIKGGGASTPSGSQASMTSAQYSSPLSGALQGRLTSAQSSKTEAETSSVQTDVIKKGQEIDNLKTENEKAKALTDNIRQEYQNLVKQGLNLTEVGNEIRKRIDLMTSQINNLSAVTDNVYVQTAINDLERQLKSFDVSAAKDTGNLGREYNQVKGLLDVFRTLTRK